MELGTRSGLLKMPLTHESITRRIEAAELLPQAVQHNKQVGPSAKSARHHVPSRQKPRRFQEGRRQVEESTGCDV